MAIKGGRQYMGLLISGTLAATSEAPCCIILSQTHFAQNGYIYLPNLVNNDYHGGHSGYNLSSLLMIISIMV